MRIVIRKIGNSRGMIIPASLLQQVGLESEADVSVVNGALVVRAASRPVRSGWARASQQLAASGDGALLIPEFGNDNDDTLQW